ncbi:tRNA (adenosine(37)-N6)-threonylcarbamoyltransferase complex dimerization subunit type 1 TsaB [Pedobacter boryungensis]|uniref:tRNA (Adenosine(37)-N6)-threonylcarbamoyltransferase complex dimerization subunit type 1 TsaB n=1 Tax=Pedobacter boryungensis TaxID=869962 RepID=A0ABX2DAX4_9SPHI|nr:tRNA (adenosine(37)-N6)-threonylcarbamoyltransferase complex dimerization subunit type 1 TsaB [Pedobacter boryungensis]NQX31180.1 tRNA (adenosine(37)-N6)-threonylcarbamoyltransferase complex dimerization subunit type 1 TsaB [Pedobacter boryungensis]
MPTILQIETATQVCSVALAVDGETIALKEEKAQNIHASSLTLFIDEVMNIAKLKYADLDAIAVSKGPGSYTGLRIGVSTAKGLCFALDKPLIGVNTLQMMANGYLSQHPNYGGLVCPMIDARRMEVFTAVYTNKLHEVVSVNAKIIDDKSFVLELDNNYITFIGDGAAKCETMLDSQNAHFSTVNFNSAANMSNLAYSAFQNENFEDVAYFEPFYLKDFVFTTSKNKS